MTFYEEKHRTYSNGVKIVYEQIEEDAIYIHSIISRIPQIGDGTKTTKCFLDEFQNKDIYIYSSGELGTRKDILDKWYKDLGFIACTKNNLPYNVTHCIERVK